MNNIRSQIVDYSLCSDFFESFDVSCFTRFSREQGMVGSHAAILMLDDQIVSLADLFVKSGTADVIIIDMEVNPMAKRQQFGLRLLSSIFDYASNLATNYSNPKGYVLTDGFTELGKKHLLPELRRLDSQYENVTYYSITAA